MIQRRHGPWPWPMSDAAAPTRTITSTRHDTPIPDTPIRSDSEDLSSRSDFALDKPQRERRKRAEHIIALLH
jgi:hypothetical protein